MRVGFPMVTLIPAALTNCDQLIANRKPTSDRAGRKPMEIYQYYKELSRR